MQQLSTSCSDILFSLVQKVQTTIIIITFVFILSSLSNAQFSGGSGTPADPYQITTVAELHKVRNYLTSSFILMNDLEMNGAPENGVQATQDGWWPIGYYSIPGTFAFQGTFDGGGHVIRQLHIERFEATTYQGLFGAISGAEIKNLGIEDAIVSGEQYIGVLAGRSMNNSVISNCYSTGSVYAYDFIAGGLVAINESGSLIRDSYSTAGVGSDDGGPIGGLAGVNSGTITNCYSTGLVFTSISPATFIGGLVGRSNGGSVNNSFWDTSSSEQSSSAGGTGVSGGVLQSTFINAGWDYVGETTNGTNDNWNGSSGFPILSWQDRSGPLVVSVPFSGDGTPGNPYQITTVSQLNQVRNYLSKNFILMNDLDMQGTPENGTVGQEGGWFPIGVYANTVTIFTGSFDGNGHIISNLYIKRLNSSQIVTLDALVPSMTVLAYPQNIGLFAVTNAEIKNLGLVNAAIEGQRYVGTISGRSVGGIIRNCYSTGEIIAHDHTAGGLAGQITSGSQISNCYSTADVFTHNSIAGGLVGVNNSTIINSYSTGSITSDNTGVQFTGGLAGASGGTITNSFWNTESSGMASSPGGTGLTTSSAKTLLTFTNAGWDFENETTNGTNNYWDMDTTGVFNGGYPYLSWQDGSSTSLPVELASFTAKSISGGTRRGVILQWSTATEVNNYGFEVQRSEIRKQKSEDRSQNFKSIAFVNGTGNSNVSRDYEFTDENLLPGNYLYRLKQIDNDGTFTYSGIVEASFMKPDEFVLEQNYPNPFNPVTKFGFRISNAGFVSLKVYDILGNEVATLVNESREPGNYEIQFNSSSLSSGLYMYKLESNGEKQIRKMLLLK